MAGRGNWKSWYEFLFSCIGCLVGLGNIWSVMSLLYYRLELPIMTERETPTWRSHGIYLDTTGAFLIPYFIFIIVCALPLFFLEMSYAQFANLGPGRAWILCPLFKGIGYGMVTLTGIVSVYYTVILAWTLFYFAMSFSATLPWSTCSNDWNTAACYSRTAGNISNITQDVTTGINVSVSVSPTTVGFNATPPGVTEMVNSTLQKRVTPSEEFWQNKVLELTSGVDEPGYIRWQLLLCLLAAWLIVFLCLIKGIKSSGKVMYVAATVPYLLLLVLLVRGAMLPGAMDGLKFYAIPRWEKLLSFNVWGDAAIQMFYSAGLGWGGISTLASYNNFHNNVERDAFVLPIVDAVTSWFAGCVIFVNLGYMAHSAGVSVDSVVSQGPGIAFMVYPEALAQLPVPQLWSVLFFLMLFTVGLDSQVVKQFGFGTADGGTNVYVPSDTSGSNLIVHVQTLTSALMDSFPKYLLNRKLLVTAGVCVTSFILGIPCVTQGGVYVLQILDWYCASVSVMFLVFMEVVVITWLYGTRRLYRDIELMLGRRLGSGWGVLWMYVTPIIILLIWVSNLVQLKPVKYGDITYPDAAVVFGWLIAFLSLVPVPIYACITLTRGQGTILERLRKSVKPDPKWGPAKQELQAEYQSAMEDGHVMIIEEKPAIDAK